MTVNTFMRSMVDRSRIWMANTSTTSVESFWVGITMVGSGTLREMPCYRRTIPVADLPVHLTNSSLSRALSSFFRSKASANLRPSNRFFHLVGRMIDFGEARGAGQTCKANAAGGHITALDQKR